MRAIRVLLQRLETAAEQRDPTETLTVKGLPACCIERRAGLTRAL